MKRWLGVLLLLCMLCGCSDTTPQTQDRQTEPPTEEVTEAPTVLGLYDHGNPVEMETLGAVRAFNLLAREDCTGIAPMGNDILLFQEDRLTLLLDPWLTEYTSVEIPGLPTPDSGLVQVKSDGVAYYDRASGNIVFLGSNLRETMRLHLPEDIVGDAWLDKDWDVVYYCTETDIRVLDMKTGVSRLLKEQGALSHTITGVLLNDQFLRCTAVQADGTEKTVLLSTQTGEKVYEGDCLDSLVGPADNYFIQLEQEIVAEWIFGTVTGEPQNLCTAQEADAYWVLWEDSCVITARYTDAGAQLEVYRLDSGLRSAEVVLTGVQQLEDVWVTEEGTLWLRSGSTIFRWTPQQSPTDDEKVYTAPRYTREQPDEEGLAAVQTQVSALEQKYGVELLIWNEALDVTPWDYTFETEFVPRAYERSIALLDQIMANFPENFFLQAAERSANAKLTIVLVRGIYGSAEMGTLASAEGVQYWGNDGNVYIALRTGKQLERYFYHEMGHLVDTKVLSNSTACYEWDKLNPPGFQYDGDYILNASRQDTQYLQEADRWFIDMYSMSFAVEDRARILEYASLPGNASYFTSATMQQKLLRVCTGIREAFGLTDDPRSFIWEQYLQK